LKQPNAATTFLPSNAPFLQIKILGEIDGPFKPGIYDPSSVVQKTGVPSPFSDSGREQTATRAASGEVSEYHQRPRKQTLGGLQNSFDPLASQHDQ
jgi:hypothetical protein